MRQRNDVCYDNINFITLLQIKSNENKIIQTV